MKNVLILHGWFDIPSDHWYQELKSELEKFDFTVSIPELKDKDNPNIADWAKCALENFKIDENTVIIGHSLGSALALNILENSKQKIDKLITVAGWDYWDLTPEHETFFEKRFDYKKIIENSGERYAIHSDCDPYVTEFIANEYAKRIQAKFIVVPGAKHFIREDGSSPTSQIVDILK